jgi:hypothetical protein
MRAFFGVARRCLGVDFESIVAESKQCLYRGNCGSDMGDWARDEASDRCRCDSVRRVGRINNPWQKRYTYDRHGDNTSITLEGTRWFHPGDYLPHTQSKEAHELDLLCSLHLQLQHDRNGKTEENNLCDHLIHNRQVQNYDPVHAFRSGLLSEIPYSVDRDALEGSQAKEGKRECSGESHKGVNGPLEPYIRKDAEVQAKDAVLQ